MTQGGSSGISDLCNTLHSFRTRALPVFAPCGVSGAILQTHEGCRELFCLRVPFRDIRVREFLPRVVTEACFGADLRLPPYYINISKSA